VTSDDALLACIRSIARGDPQLDAATARAAFDREFFFSDLRHQVYRGDTALHLAAVAYKSAIARELVRLGANVTTANRRGQHPLHYAVDGGPGGRWNPTAQREIVSCRVGLGADIEAVDKNGTTPLLRAIRNRCTGAVAALLEAGVDPTATNAKGSTPLQLASWTTGRGGTGSDAARVEQQAIIDLLRAAGAT